MRGHPWLYGMAFPVNKIEFPTNLHFESQHFDDLTVEHFAISFGFTEDIIVVDQCDITFVIRIFGRGSIVLIVTIITNCASVQRIDAVVFVVNIVV